MTPFVPVPGVPYDACAFPNPGGTVAVVCLWQPVERAVERHPDAFMVGPTVSPVGVDYVCRTLLANPQITRLIVQGPDLSGTRALLAHALQGDFPAGFPDDLKGALEGLVAPRGAEVGGEADRYDLNPDRVPLVLPVPLPPPGTVGTRRGPPARTFVGTSLWTVWPRLLGEVVRHGAESPTAYGSRQRELLAVSWTFGVGATLTTTPPWVREVLNGLGEDAGEADLRDALDAYARVHFLGTEARSDGVAYTYYGRLTTMGDDQIARCIETLRADPEQRRAVAVTWDVGQRGPVLPTTERDATRPSDAAGKNPPCLTHLWFRRDEDGSLYTHATFRSHDLLQAGVPNAWGLCRLAEYVARALGWPVGRLTICSLSGHVYDQGWAQAKQIAQERGRGAAYEEDDRAILRVRRVEDGVPPLAFSTALGRRTQAHVDALSPEERRVLELRFSFEARVAVDLLLPDGSTADTIEGRTEAVEREVLERGWVSTLSHAAWLGRELARTAGA